MGEAKRWYTTNCQIHGIKPKGQSYGEVVVPEPTGKKLGRHRTECPHCRAARLKARNEEA